MIQFISYCIYHIYFFKRFIEEGIAQNFRIDGRGRFDFRPFVLETGVVSQTNGSARYN